MKRFGYFAIVSVLVAAKLSDCNQGARRDNPPGGKSPRNKPSPPRGEGPPPAGKAVRFPTRAEERRILEYCQTIYEDVVELCQNQRRREAKNPCLLRSRSCRASARALNLLGATTRTLEIAVRYLVIQVLKQRIGIEFGYTEGQVKRLTSVVNQCINIGNRQGVRKINGMACEFPKHETFTCYPNSKYRTPDGSCNNLNNAQWGSSELPLSRMLPPMYGGTNDFPNTLGDCEPRTKSIVFPHKDLPSARKVAAVMHSPRFQPHVMMSEVSDMIMTFGQFVDHDITKTAMQKVLNGTEGLRDPDCGEDNCLNADRSVKKCMDIPSTNDEGGDAEAVHCFGIRIDSTDIDFVDEKCLKFVRSEQVTDLDCKEGEAQQLNQISSYFDLGLVYGNNNATAKKLRDLNDISKLDIVPHPFSCTKKGLLPPQDNVDCKEHTGAVDDIRKCMTAGDGRVNEHHGLTSVHLFFARQHNLIVENLARLENPGWDAEKLYQEARRIFIAQWQYIVYNEWLPLNIGPSLIYKYDVKLKDETDPYYTGYDSSLNPNGINAFATAAFRFGHSQISQHLRSCYGSFEDCVDQEFSEAFFRPGPLYATGANEGPDASILGMLAQRAHQSDSIFQFSVDTQMFSDDPPHTTGTSLPALNIQRGRDHGLPPYIDYVHLCRQPSLLPKPASFDDLVDIIPSKLLRDKLASVYENVEDIDLFTGGLAEAPLPGSMVGPTFGCIIGEQFHRLRAGDRFWFETDDEKLKFTEEQLTEIRKSKLSKIFCDNSDDIKKLQPWALLAPGFGSFDVTKRPAENTFSQMVLEKYGTNKVVDCECIQQIDFTKWKETST